MLVTWLSYPDLIELTRCALFAPEVGHTIVYGVSANRDAWWNNRQAAHIGYVPQDSSEPYRAKIEALPALDPADPAARYQGGGFVKAGPFGDADGDPES
jgi:uronate dehydrogenase